MSEVYIDGTTSDVNTEAFNIFLIKLNLYFEGLKQGHNERQLNITKPVQIISAIISANYQCKLSVHYQFNCTLILSANIRVQL